MNCINVKLRNSETNMFFSEPFCLKVFLAAVEEGNSKASFPWLLMVIELEPCQTYCFNQPARPFPNKYDALSPSYFTQVMG